MQITTNVRTAILNQLQPFNEVRFDSAIGYLSHIHKRPLSKFEAVKLHFLADVFHTLWTGTPIIGGTLEAWPNGPVAEEAYARLEQWCDRFEYNGESPEHFRIREKGRLRYLEPNFEPDPEDFSSREIKALEEAWNLLMPMMDRGYEGYMEAQAYFHSDKTFIGRAYNKAKANARTIDWNDIIDAYDEVNGTNHSHIKTLMQL